MRLDESEQVLEISQTTGKEFRIITRSLVSLEDVVTQLAAGADLTAVIALESFAGEGQLTFEVSGADATGGTIAIAGQNAAGTTQSETLTFTGADQSMTTTNSYVITNLTATPSTFTQGTADASVLVGISGSWLVQSSRRNVNPRRWRNEFEVGDALTVAIPIAEIQGSPTRIYRVTGGNVGVEGWVDDVFDRNWR